MQGVPVDTAGLADGPFATMQMLYERTLLNVDVLRLTLRFDAETALQLERLGAGAPPDSIAAVALQSRNVLVRSEFLRNVDLDQFLDGLQQSLDGAHRAGILSDTELETVLQSVNTEYSVLAERGIRDGDTMWYRIRGDSLHVAVQAPDGHVLLESRPVGPERRRAVLGGYLAPGSDFREKLVESLPGGG